MNLKCKHCGGTLTFDPDLQQMVCDHCLSMFPVEESTKKHVTLYGDNSLTGADAAQDELMDFKIYHCNNCGAELMINDVELASYCAYCGQPSIVYSRTEKRLKPQFIIPFQIGRNEAIATIREKFVKSDYVDKEAMYFEPELLRGIYIPYALFCYEVRAKALMKGIPDRETANGMYKYYYQQVFSRVGHIPVDASYHFPNKSADQLEPFQGKDLVPFDTGYLSGYYADLRDEDFNQLKSRADGRAKKIFEKRLTLLPFVNKVQIVKEKIDLKCVKEVYALLPAWFMVLKYNNEKYTIMVNGQSGKVVGALPTSNRKMILWFLASFIVCLLIIFPLSIVVSFTGYFFVPYLAYLASPVILYSGYRNIQKYARNKKLSTSRKMRLFARERQKK